jgi:hypothetical protein
MSTVDTDPAIDLAVLLELSIGSPLGQFRTVPITLGGASRNTFLATYCADYDVDASIGMFAYPTDRLKIIVFDEMGEVHWRRELGPGVVPGGAFCPFYAFDLNGDGVDEVWFVNNVDGVHPFAAGSYRLERADGQSGATTGQWQWPNHGGRQSLSHTFRNHLLGGYVHGEPVLVTAQGTYAAMFVQAWGPGMTPRWEKAIGADAPGARGSHVYPVLDLNGDGVDEFMWGERCLSFDDGRELFCADEDSWQGHSDMVQPILDREHGRWFLYVNRESHPGQAPRVLLYDDHGARVWSAVDRGHIHKGWVGRIGAHDELMATAIRIGGQVKGPSGRFYEGVSEFMFDALTGVPVAPAFSVFDTAPIDLNGDGRHEILRGLAAGNTELLDRRGERIGALGGKVSMASRLLHHPGEQAMCFYPDGTVRVWGDRSAVDHPSALERYVHPTYQANRRFPTTENRLCMLGGI